MTTSPEITKGPSLPAEHALEHQILRRDGDGWELVGSRCDSCERHYYPPRELCPQDLTRCEEVALSRDGFLYEATQIHVAPVGFTAPFWLGYVDLPEQVRVFAQIQPAEGHDPRHGDRVELMIRQVRTDPREIIGPVFTLAG